MPSSYHLQSLLSGNHNYVPHKVLNRRFGEQENEVKDMVNNQPSHVLRFRQILTLSTHQLRLSHSNAAKMTLPSSQHLAITIIPSHKRQNRQLRSVFISHHHMSLILLQETDQTFTRKQSRTAMNVIDTSINSEVDSQV